MCSYPGDGASDGQINLGCGQAGAVLKVNPCMNTDPVTGKQYTTSDGAIKDAICQKDVKENGCQWSAPQLGSYVQDNSTFKDDTHNMLRSKYVNGVAKGFSYNEIIINWVLQDKISKEEGIGSVISAMVAPINGRCGYWCQYFILQLLDQIAAAYGDGQIPIVGMDQNDMKTPFRPNPIPESGPTGHDLCDKRTNPKCAEGQIQVESEVVI